MPANSTLHVKAFEGPNMPLPMIAAFKREDIVITGKVLTLVKRKGLLFNCYSSVAFRHVAILRNGMLMVYETDRAGWALDMKHMLKMKTTTMHTKHDKMRRLQLEFKTTRGTISMVAIGADSARWMDALSGVLKEPEEVEDDVSVPEVEEKEKDDRCSTVTLIEEEGVISPLIDESRDQTPSKSQESNSAVSSHSTTYSVVLRYTEPKSIVVPNDSTMSETPKRTPIRTMTTPQTSQKKAVSRTLTQPADGYRRPASPLPPTGSPTDSSATESVRHGVHSVATLRNMLEARTRVSIRKVRSSKKSAAGVPTAVVLAEEKKVIEEEEKSRDTQRPWLRCRPSKSAPAAVALPLGKKVIVGNYNGCFDSSHA